MKSLSQSSGVGVELRDLSFPHGISDSPRPLRRLQSFFGYVGCLVSHYYPPAVTLQIRIGVPSNSGSRNLFAILVSNHRNAASRHDNKVSISVYADVFVLVWQRSICSSLFCLCGEVIH